MSRTRTILAAAVALAALTGTAHATDWWVLNHKTAACESAKAMAARYHYPAAASPALLEADSRRDGTFERTNVYRLDDNTISNVEVVSHRSVSGDNWVADYFPNQALCAIARDAAIASGDLNNPDELK